LYYIDIFKLNASQKYIEFILNRNAIMPISIKDRLQQGLGGCPKIEFVKFTPQHIAFYYLIIHCILWLIFKSLHSRTAS